MADNVLGASGEADAPTTYWICKGCPLPEECTESIWKRCKKWGNTLEECKEQVLEHLQRSGKHEEATQQYGGADRSEYFQQMVHLAEYKQMPVAIPSAQRGKKRRHQSEDAHGGGGDAESHQSVNAHGGGGDAEITDIAAVQRAVRDVIVRERNINHWDIIRMIMPEKGAIVPPPPRKIKPSAKMTIQEIKMLIDMLQRASVSASNLARLLANTANACFDEKAVIFEARDMARVMIEAAGGHWSPSL